MIQPDALTLLKGLNPAFELSVVFKYITYGKRGTILSVAAIALAVAISLTMVSLQDGF